MTALNDFLDFQSVSRPRLSARERRRLFVLHRGVCHICAETIDPVREAWDIEHVIAWALTHDNSDENCRPAHERCHDPKTHMEDVPMIAKAVRQEARHMGFKSAANPMPGSKKSRFRKRMNGTVEYRR
jgi:5-methylcytosine-specific restriction endonuclease McrA